MPKLNPAQYFQDVLDRVTMHEKDAIAESFRLHQRGVEAKLWSSFGLDKIVVIGSFSRGTVVKGSSDLDLMAVLKREEVRWGNRYKSSKRVLSQVRERLAEKYPSTVVRPDRQAIVVDFGQGRETVDVVPAYYSRQFQKKYGLGQYPIYKIPDGKGGWKETSPELHDKFFLGEEKRSQGKLPRLSRLLKVWRASRNAAGHLHSLHLELLLASSGICVGPKTYATCMTEAFELLSSRRCRPLRDPQHWAGLIPAAASAPKQAALLATVNTSLQLARRALEEEGNRRPRVAADLWAKVLFG